MKSRQNYYHIKNNNRLTLNFLQISRNSCTIENHVRQFMLTLSPQIEAKNIHISVGQGSMPDQRLFTDWTIFDQILY